MLQGLPDLQVAAGAPRPAEGCRRARGKIYGLVFRTLDQTLVCIYLNFFIFKVTL